MLQNHKIIIFYPHRKELSHEMNKFDLLLEAINPFHLFNAVNHHKSREIK